MVKHHVKSKKKNSSNNAKAEGKKQKDLLKDLDRFAGSSEEEEGPHDDTDDESLGSDTDVKQMQGVVDEEEIGSMGEDDVSSDDDEYGAPAVNQRTANKAIDSDSDDDLLKDLGTVDEQSQSGMSGAMARILGLKAPAKAKATKSVVLSKTFTPLQKQQKKEKEEQDALKMKRKLRRDVNLTALHIPLSAATSRPMMGKDSDSDIVAEAMAKEIEVESMHRRVATRGVVALFNTIAQHQQQKAQQQGVTAKKNDDVQSMSKHGFLDMLKKTGSSKTEESTGKSKSSKTSEGSNEKKTTTKGWNALKDDFMMVSKLKDWDKALSDEEDSEDEDDDAGRGTKRAADDDDAVMDDDWSSDEEKPKKRKVAA